MEENLNTQEVVTKRVEKQAPPQRVVKSFKGEWYNLDSIFGNEWARFFYLL